MSDRLLKTAEVAERLALSVGHAERLIARGDIEVVRIGSRAVRVTEAAVDRFIASRTHKARPGRLRAS